jgi:hypothetical protein
VIRFVDRLAPAPVIRYVGRGEVAFTEDASCILGGNLKEGVRTQIPFQQIGRACEIICENKVLQVPLLIPIVNWTMLAKGILPLHASAFIFEGTGALAAGWPHGSKTGTLLALMSRGARYVGDDWVYVSRDHRRMYGLPSPIEVRERYLVDIPQYRAHVGWRRLTRLRATKGLVRALNLVGRLRGNEASLSAKLLSRMSRAIEGRLHIRFHPHDLFGHQACARQGTLHKVFLLIHHQSADVRIEPIDPEEMAERMVMMLLHEQTEFMTYYRKLRFVFPHACNELIDCSEELQRLILIRALADKDAYFVYHPHPSSLPALFEAIQPFLCS